ncbi:MAG: hypothetical protein JST30_13010 [Armatimonadetes bacterium]|nr:hypothetical protein [Armatimonadota bacterium]
MADGFLEPKTARSFWTVATGVLVLTGALGCLPEPEPVVKVPRLDNDYRAEEARLKLEAIGRALKVYRVDHGVKPVGKWKTLADAGLPSNLDQLVRMTEPGHKWSIKPVLLRLSASRKFDAQNNIAWSHFTFPLYGPGSAAPRNGERTVFCIDENGYSLAAATRALKRELLVLRIDGTVETVTTRLPGIQGIE